MKNPFNQGGPSYSDFLAEFEQDEQRNKQKHSKKYSKEDLEQFNQELSNIEKVDVPDISIDKLMSVDELVKASTKVKYETDETIKDVSSIANADINKYQNPKPVSINQDKKQAKINMHKKAIEKLQRDSNIEDIFKGK